FRPRSTHQEVTEMADFKNVSFLTQFLSPAGRIQPRRVTKLTEPLQRRIAKSVKLARNMALMAGEARLDKLHLTRVRQEELHRYQLKKSVQ
uniref:bS18m n=1 Tax=Polytomella magna TaxID=353565 RepID=UPI002240E3DD|nr:Chain Br, bS18m [Polytomella magna]8APN_Br Chain Br, bS18m [Polytomella magna]8APO_Br Chain Br, bS18m [Polytomella magna]